MAVFQLTVNGRRHSIDADGDMPLVWVLRDILGLTGTKYGCGEGSCGACTVLDGVDPVRSCQVALSSMVGSSITTIESRSDLVLEQCRQAWLQEDASQCGYCQAGMLLETRALLAEKANPSDQEINDTLDGHLYRCGSYPRVRKAVKLAAATVRKR